MIRQILTVSGVATALTLACATEPLCACSEPGSRLIVYGTTTALGTGELVPDVQIEIQMSTLLEADGACVYPGPDSPETVVSDAWGRYRVEILTVARFTRCLTVTATRSSPQPALGTVIPDMMVVLGPPGTTDSIPLTLQLVPQ